MSRCLPCGAGPTSKWIKYSSNSSPLAPWRFGRNAKGAVLNHAFRAEVDISESTGKFELWLCPEMLSEMPYYAQLDCRFGTLENIKCYELLAYSHNLDQPLDSRNFFLDEGQLSLYFYFDAGLCALLFSLFPCEACHVMSSTTPPSGLLYLHPLPIILLLVSLSPISSPTESDSMGLLALPFSLRLPTSALWPAAAAIHFSR